MNIEWQKLTVEDKEALKPYYSYEQSNSCEVCFANNILWSPFYELEYAFIEEMLVFITRRKQYSVGMPMAKDENSEKNLKKVLLILEEYFKAENQIFHLHYLEIKVCLV